MEHTNIFAEYSPLIAVVLMYFLQLKIFVTPDMLEKKHREILDEAQERFAARILVDDLKEEISQIKEKIDKIYDMFITGSK